jgi:glycosyltransferase involved in cell wall biosynthesis
MTLNVLQVLPALEGGGVEQETLLIAGAVSRAPGMKSFVASAGGPLVKNLLENGSSHVALPLNKKNPYTLWRNSQRLIKIIKKYNIQIIHVRSRAPAWSCIRAAHKTGIKLVSTIHGAYKCQNAIKKKYNSGMVNVDRVIAISEYIKDYVLHEYNVNSERLTLIPRGIDTNYFIPQPLSANKVPTLVIPARFTRLKGHLVALEAISMIKTPVKVILAGAGNGKTKYHAEIERCINNFHLQDRVDIIPYTPDIKVIYAMADIVLNPSLVPEAFGRTIAEAMAMEKLVIASDLGAPKEIIQNDESGWLVPAGNPEMLAKKIQYVLDLPSAERKRIGGAARARVQSNYTLENMCEKTLQLYLEITGNV